MKRRSSRKFFKSGDTSSNVSRTIFFVQDPYVFFEHTSGAKNDYSDKSVKKSPDEIVSSWLNNNYMDINCFKMLQISFSRFRKASVSADMDNSTTVNTMLIEFIQIP